MEQAVAPIVDAVCINFPSSVSPDTDHITQATSFHLIETMRFRHRIHYLNDHLQRMGASANALKIPYKESAIRHAILQELEGIDRSRAFKIRLTLSEEGLLSITKNVLMKEAKHPRRVVLSPHRVDSGNDFLYHKTTRRKLYEREYLRVLADGYYEVLFSNEHGELTEGSRNNVFIKNGAYIFTPLIDCGVLSGVYRASLLNRCPAIIEKKLSVDELLRADAIYVSNAVRGLRKVSL